MAARSTPCPPATWSGGSVVVLAPSGQRGGRPAAAAAECCHRPVRRHRIDQGPATPVDQGVNLGRQATARPTDAAIIRLVPPPARTPVSRQRPLCGTMPSTTTSHSARPAASRAPVLVQPGDREVDADPPVHLAVRVGSVTRCGLVPSRCCRRGRGGRLRLTDLGGLRACNKQGSMVALVLHLRQPHELVRTPGDEGRQRPRTSPTVTR